MESTIELWWVWGIANTTTLLKWASNSWSIPPRLAHSFVEALLVAPCSDDVKPTSYSIGAKHPAWCDTMKIEFDALLRNDTWTLIAPTFDMNIYSWPQMILPQTQSWLFNQSSQSPSHYEWFPSTIWNQLQRHVQLGGQAHHHSPCSLSCHLIWMVYSPNWCSKSLLASLDFALTPHSFFTHLNTQPMFLSMLTIFSSPFLILKESLIFYPAYVLILPSKTWVLSTSSWHESYSYTWWPHFLLTPVHPRSSPQLEAKPIKSSMSFAHALSLFSEDPLTDPSPYCSLIDAFQYLSLTHLDISTKSLN